MKKRIASGNDQRPAEKAEGQRPKVKTHSLTFLICLLPFAFSLASPFDYSDWPGLVTITFDGYEGSEVLKDFPTLIKFDATAAGLMLPGGADLRFTDDGGELLAHEVDTWDDASETWLAWVRVPSLEKTAKIYAHIGNGNPGPHPLAAADTWAPEFALVQHFNEPNGGLVVLDATGGGNHAKLSPSTIDGPRAAGKIGGAADLSPDNNRNRGIILDKALDIGDNWTFSAWFSGLQGTGDWRTLTRGANYHHVIIEDVSFKLGRYQGGFHQAGSAEMNPANFQGWHHIAAVGDKDGGETRFYINGEPYATGAYTSDSILEGIACYQGNVTQKFSNYLDEFRAESAVRSDDWVKAAYMTAADPGAFAFMGPVQMGDDILVVAQTPSLVRSISATAHGRLVSAGLGETGAAVYIAWAKATVQGAPGTWPNFQFVATSEPDAFTFAITGLDPAAQYQYAFLASNATDSAWSNTVLFDTKPQSPLAAIVSAADGFGAATVGVRVTWGGEFDAGADLLLFAAVSDHGPDIANWFAASVPFATASGSFGVDTLVSVPYPDAQNTFFCRAFAANEFGTNAAPDTVKIASLLRGMPGQRDWVWTGAVSPDWNDCGNWVDAATLAPCDDIGKLRGTSVLLCNGPHLSNNQNIANPTLALSQIYVDMREVPGNLVVSGDAIALAGTLHLNNIGNQGPHRVEFHNDFTLAAGQIHSVFIRPLHFYGDITESGPRRWYFTQADVHYHGAVKTTGGFSHDWGTDYHFYGDKTTGAAPDVFNPNYFHASFNFHSPDGLACEYDLAPEKGVNGVTLRPDPKVTVVVNAPVTEGGIHHGGAYGNDGSVGVLELASRHNTFTGGFNNYNGGIIVQEPLAAGTAPNACILVGFIDLNGVDMLGRDMFFYARNDDGTIRNQNPFRALHVDGDINSPPHNTGLLEGSGNVFSGIGDVLHSGLVKAHDFGYYEKSGSGTLTWTGPSQLERGTWVSSGTLVLDYATHPAPKLAPGRNLAVLLEVAARNHRLKSLGYNSAEELDKRIKF